MSKYVEIGYPIYDGMGVYPGLPIPTVKIREDLTKGDPWNGSVMDIYLHAGTHCDAPWHYMGGDAPKMDDVEALPPPLSDLLSYLILACHYFHQIPS